MRLGGEIVRLGGGEEETCDCVISLFLCDSFRRKSSVEMCFIASVKRDD